MEVLSQHIQPGVIGLATNIGGKIISQEGGMYYAIDMKDATKWFQDEKWSVFYANNKIAVQYDRHGYYVDSSGRLYEESSLSSKDLEKYGALIEHVKVNAISRNFVDEYGLSESRSLQLAKMTMAYSKVMERRAITPADNNVFAKELLGFSIEEAERAYQSAIEGDQSAVDRLLQVAADKNDSTPEHMRDLMDIFMQ